MKKQLWFLVGDWRLAVTHTCQTTWSIVAKPYWASGRTVGQIVSIRGLAYTVTGRGG